MMKIVSELKRGDVVVRTSAPFESKNAANKEVMPGTRLKFIGLDPVSVHLSFMNVNETVIVDRNYWENRWFTPVRG